MSARSASSFPRADPLKVATVAAVGVAAFAASWALLHTGFYDDVAIVDTPVYRGYGDRMVDGQVPYRDFGLEYPPAALPAFALPSLAGSEDYGAVFELLMLACGAGAVCLVALALAAAGVSAGALVGGVSFAALSPLLLGPVLLSRYDLWPAVLTVAALAALARGRDRLGLGVLGLAVGTVGDREHERPVGADGDAGGLEALGQWGHVKDPGGHRAAADLEEAGAVLVPPQHVDALGVGAPGRG